MRGVFNNAENVPSMSLSNRFVFARPGNINTSNVTTNNMGSSVSVGDPLLAQHTIDNGAKTNNSAINNTGMTSINNTGVTSMSTPFMVPKYPIPILPSAGLAIPAIPTNNTVPEFLYQLTKMLTGGHKDIIEWSNGKIEVHNPLKLQNKVLHKYFRHSKFASFQRQLNYFGFRKIAGKGKMAPCSYINEAVTQDIGSLLLIKRKTTTSISGREKSKINGNISSRATSKPAGIAGVARFKAVAQVVPQQSLSTTQVNVVNKSLTARLGGPMAAIAKDDRTKSHHALAKTAVGRGVRHSYTGTVANPLIPSQGKATSALNTTSFTFPTGVEESLSQLSDNFQNTLNEFQEKSDKANVIVDNTTRFQNKIETNNVKTNESIDIWKTSSFGQLVEAEQPTGGMLSRDSSLIELAMIPTIDYFPANNQTSFLSSDGMHFVDFPHEEINPGCLQRNNIQLGEREPSI